MAFIKVGPERDFGLICSWRYSANELCHLKRKGRKEERGRRREGEENEKTRSKRVI